MPQLQTCIEHLPWNRRFATLVYPPLADKLEYWAGVYKYKIVGEPKTPDPVYKYIRKTIHGL
jgi:hypothetical protein